MCEEIGLRIRDLGSAPDPPLCVQVLSSVGVSCFGTKVSHRRMKVDNRGAPYAPLPCLLGAPDSLKQQE